MAYFQVSLSSFLPPDAFALEQECGGGEEGKGFYKGLAASKQSTHFIVKNDSSLRPFFFATLEFRILLLSVAKIFSVQTSFWFLIPSRWSLQPRLLRNLLKS